MLQFASNKEPLYFPHVTSKFPNQKEVESHQFTVKRSLNQIKICHVFKMLQFSAIY